MRRWHVVEANGIALPRRGVAIGGVPEDVRVTRMESLRLGAIVVGTRHSRKGSGIARLSPVERDVTVRVRTCPPTTSSG